MVRGESKANLKQSSFSTVCAMSKHGVSDRKRNIRIFALVVFIIFIWSLVLFCYSPGEIVELLGVRNVYAFVFLLAVIGGVSTLTSTTFYTALVTLALGDVNPVWLALFASVGLTFGDLVFYYLGSKGRYCIAGKYENHVFRLTDWMKNIDDRIMMLMIFLYSLTPLPSDIIAVALAIAGFPFRKMILPLLAGNFTLIILLVGLSKLGYSFI